MVRHAAFAALLLSCPVAARAQADAMAQARTMAANQLGVLEYCQARGFSGADAVAAQRDAMGRLPGGTPASDAEDAGKAGTMLTGSGRQPIAQVAASFHAEVPALCRQMADAVLQTEAAMRQNGPSAGGIAGLPSMSGLPTVPGVPAISPGSTTMPGVAPAK